MTPELLKRRKLMDDEQLVSKVRKTRTSSRNASTRTLTLLSLLPLSPSADQIAEEGLQVQQVRLPEEVLRVLQGWHAVLRQLLVHRLQERP